MLEQVVVLGAGESGLGAALLAQKKGGNVFVSDAGSIRADRADILRAAGIPFEQGGHSEERILAAQLIIKSPGIPDTAPLIQKASAAGIPIWDEIELAARYSSAKVIGITGSNGKTTTTALLYHLLKTAGYAVGLGGNIGQSWAMQLAQGQDDEYMVLELSSFQLDRCYELAPELMILTNVSPDHLDRYGYEMDNYLASKLRLIQNKTAEQPFIYPKEDPYIPAGLKRYYQGSTANCLAQDWPELNAKALWVEDWAFVQDQLPLVGRHNLMNMKMALQAVKCLGMSQEMAQKGLDSFENHPHRLEKVMVLGGVQYINDSKATNVEAVYYALEAMQAPTVWMVGGVDKGNDYSSLFPFIGQPVKAIVCLGVDNRPIRAAFGAKTDYIVEAASMAEAIKLASLYAQAGDNILLSPACASFDLFKNYIDRGDQFKAILEEQRQLLEKGHNMEMNLSLNRNKK